jgi:hypothetical protein
MEVAGMNHVDVGSFLLRDIGWQERRREKGVVRVGVPAFSVSDAIRVWAKGVGREGEREGDKRDTRSRKCEECFVID